MLRFLFFIIIIALYTNTIKVFSKEVEIIHKINNQIITNLDIEKEANYLVAINNSYKNIEINKLKNIAKDSLIREVIKKNELIKYFKLGEKNQLVTDQINKIFTQTDLSSKNEIQIYLNNFNIDYDYVYKKIEIETKWNQLIYEIYNKKIILDDNKIINDIKNKFDNSIEYHLSEILIRAENLNELNDKYLKVVDEINSKGFKNAALIYSETDSKKNSGDIGWINENNLSEKILEKLKQTKINEITQPIPISNGVLLLLINDKRKFLKNENRMQEELEKFKIKTMNDQLSNYSSLHFNKIKNNLLIK